MGAVLIYSSDIRIALSLRVRPCSHLLGIPHPFGTEETIVDRLAAHLFAMIFVGTKFYVIVPSLTFSMLIQSPLHRQLCPIDLIECHIATRPPPIQASVAPDPEIPNSYYMKKQHPAIHKKQPDHLRIYQPPRVLLLPDSTLNFCSLCNLPLQNSTLF
eukprot:IDg870t1